MYSFLMNTNLMYEFPTINNLFPSMHHVMLPANSICLHRNPLQQAILWDATPSFRHIINTQVLTRHCSSCLVPGTLTPEQNHSPYFHVSCIKAIRWLSFSDGDRWSGSGTNQRTYLSTNCIEWNTKQRHKSPPVQGDKGGSHIYPELWQLFIQVIYAYTHILYFIHKCVTHWKRYWYLLPGVPALFRRW